MNARQLFRNNYAALHRIDIGALQLPLRIEKAMPSPLCSSLFVLISI